jgi:carbon storage regulator CsrA
MLVLSRKQGERIHIGGVMLTVLKLSTGKVRLGVDAPADMVVVKGELRDKPHLAGLARPLRRRAK